MLNIAQRRIELAKGLIACLAVFAAVLFFRLAPAGAERFYPVCILYKTAGLYCPGCGTLRALEALSVPDFKSAFLYNPFLLIAAIPLMLYMGVVYLIRGISGKYVPSLLSSPKAAIPVGAVIIGIWIFRNVFPLGLG
jgi:hypothetical protein